MLFDGDQDRFPEWQCLDYDGDGIADMWVSFAPDPPATAQNQAVDDLMTTNIVTLNQLRQLDPYSLGYIPYDPAPSILR